MRRDRARPPEAFTAARGTLAAVKASKATSGVSFRPAAAPRVGRSVKACAAGPSARRAGDIAAGG